VGELGECARAVGSGPSFHEGYFGVIGGLQAEIVVDDIGNDIP
jgi:hypothetical protein